MKSMIKITNELYYRRIEKEDLADRVKWINDPDINETLTFDTPVSLASTEAWFAKTVLDQSKCNLAFFVRNGDSFVAIGFGGFLNIDTKASKAELYITIGNKSFQGKGFGKRLVQFLMHFGFNDLGLQKIYLSTLEHNLRAYGLYESCGFEEEGRFKKHVLHKGKLKGLIYMAAFRK